MSVTEEQISAAIESTIDPYLGIDLVAAGAINSIKIEDNSVRIEIELGFPVARYAAELGWFFLYLLVSPYPPTKTSPMHHVAPDSTIMTSLIIS